MGNLLEHPLLRRRRLEGQHLLDLVARPVVQREGDALRRARLLPLQGQAAFQKEELLEDQPDLSRSPKRLERLQVRADGGEVRLPQRLDPVRETHAPANGFRQRVVKLRQRFETTVHQLSQWARRQAAEGLVDGNDAAQMQLRVLIVVQQLVFGMEDANLAGVGVTLHLAIEGDSLASLQNPLQVVAVKPLHHQFRPGPVPHASLEQPDARAARLERLRGLDLSDHGGCFSDDERRERFDVAAVFVPKRQAVEKVLDGRQAFAREPPAALAADALQALQRRLGFDPVHKRRPAQLQSEADIEV